MRTIPIGLSLILMAGIASASGGGPGPRHEFYPRVKMEQVVRQTAPTLVALRRLRVRGALSRRQARSVLMALGPQAQGCTQIEVARLSGQMILQLQVQPDGSVRARIKRSTLGLALIDFCVRGVFEKARFPERRRASLITAQLHFSSAAAYTHTLLGPPPVKRRRIPQRR